MFIYQTTHISALSYNIHRLQEPPHECPGYYTNNQIARQQFLGSEDVQYTIIAIAAMFTQRAIKMMVYSTFSKE